jgi:mRNA interferase RelE/StbE
MTGLAENPRPHSVMKVKGFNEGYRIRVGDYRVLYKIYDSEQIVMISHILRRNEGTYRA